MRKIFLLTIPIPICFLIVLLLYLSSEKPVRYSKGFERHVIPNIIGQVKFSNLDSGTYYVAGVSDKCIFLGNHLNPTNLLVMDSSLSITDRVEILVENQQNNNPTSGSLIVEPPFFYIQDGQLPGVFEGRIGKWIARPMPIHLPLYKQAVRISNSTIGLSTIIRSTASKSSRHVLGVVSNYSSKIIWNTKILKSQYDSLFSTAGVLKFSREVNCLVYLYTYRNQYQIMDTSMNLLIRANTIDTISHAQIRSEMTSNGNHYLIAPESIVNWSAQVDGRFLFVHSNIMASNDNREIFDMSSAIDVYDISKGQYVYSFFIPNFDGRKMISFKVFENTLIAIYDRKIVLFSFNSVL